MDISLDKRGKSRISLLLWPLVTPRDFNLVHVYPLKGRLGYARAAKMEAHTRKGVKFVAVSEGALDLGLRRGMRFRN